MKLTSQTQVETGQIWRRRAYTLTEMAIVVAIIGSLVAAVWVVTGDVMQNKNVALANRQLTAIVGNLRAIYAEQGGISNGGDLTGVTLTNSLDQQRVFPMEMRGNTATQPYGILFHSWNSAPSTTFAGNVGVTAAACGGAAPTSATSIEACFGVVFFNLTQKACVQFLTNAISTGTGLQAIYVNGTALGMTQTDVMTANGACSSASSNSIEWVYILKDNGS